MAKQQHYRRQRSRPGTVRFELSLRLYPEVVQVLVDLKESKGIASSFLSSAIINGFFGLGYGDAFELTHKERMKLAKDASRELYDLIVKQREIEEAAKSRNGNIVHFRKRA